MKNTEHILNNLIRRHNLATSKMAMFKNSNNTAGLREESTVAHTLEDCAILVFGFQSQELSEFCQQTTHPLDV